MGGTAVGGKRSKRAETTSRQANHSRRKELA
jgi:hypothetical protein